MFQTRSDQLERLDTGHYTPDEYEVCLSELRFINRWIGDIRALRNTGTSQKTKLLSVRIASSGTFVPIAAHTWKNLKTSTASR